MDSVKFEQALRDQACDVVDAMLAKGYVPKPSSIKIVCENGNVTLLQTLLNYDMDIQAGMTNAIHCKQTHLLNYLFMAGANVNLLDIHGYNGLHNTTNIETCKWLLDMGVQQVSSRFGETPLFCACLLGNVELVELLLSTEQGVQSISVATDRGTTPLWRACYRRNARLAKLLLSYELGVQSISIATNERNTPLRAACCKQPEIVKLLLSHEQGVQSISIAANGGNTPLHTACYYGNTDIVKLLLSHEQCIQSISMANDKGNTPLHIACCYERLDMVKLLIPAILPILQMPQVQCIFRANKDGKTPLRTAEQHPSILALLQKLISNTRFPGFQS